MSAKLSSFVLLTVGILFACSTQAAVNYVATDIGSGLVSDDLRLTNSGTPFIMSVPTSLRSGAIWVNDINSNGLAIGSYGLYNSAEFQITPSGVTSVSVGGGGQGLAINQQGDVILGAFDPRNSAITSNYIVTASGSTINLPTVSYRRPSFNDQLQVVGSDFYGNGYLTDAGTTVSLRSLVVNSSTFSFFMPTAINDAGFIAGYGLNAQGIASAFLLTPVPEPETYAMMLAGLGLMGFIVRRRKSV